jgi:hypothetical protein
MNPVARIYKLAWVFLFAASVCLEILRIPGFFAIAVTVKFENRYLIVICSRTNDL